MIPLIKSEVEEEDAINIINVNMICNPLSSVLEMNEVKMITLENGQPEDFLILLRNFKTMINGIGTTTNAVHINDLCTMLPEK